MTPERIAKEIMRIVGEALTHLATAQKYAQAAAGEHT